VRRQKSVRHKARLCRPSFRTSTSTMSWTVGSNAACVVRVEAKPICFALPTISWRVSNHGRYSGPQSVPRHTVSAQPIVSARAYCRCSSPWSVLRPMVSTQGPWSVLKRIIGTQALSVLRHRRYSGPLLVPKVHCRCPRASSVPREKNRGQAPSTTLDSAQQARAQKQLFAYAGESV
jgi:hypothetical protein